MAARIKTANPKNSKVHNKNKREKQPTAMDLLKLEIAAELGLANKVKTEGWGALTSTESGRIGGIITQRAKKGLIDLDTLRSDKK